MLWIIVLEKLTGSDHWAITHKTKKMFKKETENLTPVILKSYLFVFSCGGKIKYFGYKHKFYFFSILLSFSFALKIFILLNCQ